jgi:uncharacterized repeat protein (TIGR01451 family)
LEYLEERLAPASADMAVVTTGPVNITAGAPATYTITLTNKGPDAAQGVVLTDSVFSTAGGSFFMIAQAGNPDPFTIVGNPTSQVATASGSIASGNVDVFLSIYTTASSTASGVAASDSNTVTATTPDPDNTNNTSAANSTVVTSADLSVTMTGPADITAGGFATYTITLTNNGPSDAQSVSLNDALPTGLTLASESQLSGPDTFKDNSAANTATFNANTVAAGNADVFQVVGAVDPNAARGSTVSNTATAATTTSDPTSGDDSSTATGTVVTPADLSVTVSGPATVTAGALATYTISLTNKGPYAAHSVTLTDMLPAGETLQSEKQLPGGSDTFTDTSSGNTASFGFNAAAGMAVNNTDSFEVVALVASGQADGSTLTNTATAASTDPNPNPADGSSSTTATVAALADLSVTITGPATATAGTSATYTITLADNGPSDAKSVSLTDTLPAGATNVTLTPDAKNPDTFTVSQLGNTLTATANAAVVAKNVDVFTLTLFAPSSLGQGADFSEQVSATSTTTDPNTNNNQSTATATITTSADVSVTATGPATVTAGSATNYTITLNNLGPSDAKGVTLTDSVPSGTVTNFKQLFGPDSFNFAMDFSSATATSPIKPQSTDVFELDVTPASSLLPPSPFTISGTASTTTTDPNLANNTYSVLSAVTTSADLSVTIVPPAAGITAGALAKYTISITNLGPSDAQSVKLTDAVPGAVTSITLDQLSGPQAFFISPDFTTATAPTMLANSTDTFELDVLPPANLPAASNFTVTAAITSTTTDPIAANNQNASTAPVQTSADLSITATGPAQVTAGTSATFTITLHNSGPSDAQTVSLTDVVPTGATSIALAPLLNPDGFSTATSATAGPITVNAATVAANNTDTFLLTLFAPSSLATGTTFNDTASVSSKTSDPNTGNNQSTATATITTSADLGVTVSGPLTVTAGAAASYTVMLMNSGPSDAVNVKITDTLPTSASAALVSVTPAMTNPDAFNTSQTGNTLTLSTATVAKGHSDLFTIVLMPASNLPLGTTLTDSATVSSDTADPVLGNNQSTATSAVTTVADLSVSMTGPVAVTAGTSVTYTITLADKGPSDAQNVSLTDTLPAGATGVTLTPAAGNPDAFAITQAGNTITATAKAAVGANSVDVFTLTVLAPSNLGQGADFSEQVSVTGTTFDPNTANNVSSVTSAITTSADLVVSATTPSNPTTVTAGAEATYTFALTNNGPSDAQGVTFTDTLPSGGTFVRLQPLINPDNFVVTGNTTQPTTMTAGHVDTFLAVVTPASRLPNGSPFSQSAIAATSTSDPTPGDNDNADTFTSTVTVAAQLSLTPTPTAPQTVTAGSPATFTVAVSNAGPSDAQGVTLTDTFPAGTTILSVTKQSGNDSSIPSVQGSIVNEQFNTVAAGNTDVFLIVAQPASSLPSNSTFDTTVSLTSTTPNFSTSTGTTSTVATKSPLAASVSGPASAAEGDTVTYTVTVTNNGPSDANSVMLTETPPAAFKAGTVTVNGVTTSGTAASLSTLTPGQSVTATFTDVVIEDGSQMVSFTASSTNPGSATTTATTTVSEPAILANGQSIKVTEFQPLAGITVATFTHANEVEPQSTLSATIFLGDGSTPVPATISNTGTQYLVQVAPDAFTFHDPASGQVSPVPLYKYARDGTFTITTVISDEGNTTTVTSTATVLQAGVSGSPSNGQLARTINKSLLDSFGFPPSAAQINSILNAMKAADGAVLLTLASFSVAFGIPPQFLLPFASGLVQSKFATLVQKSSLPTSQMTFDNLQANANALNSFVKSVTPTSLLFA